MFGGFGAWTFLMNRDPSPPLPDDIRLPLLADSFQRLLGRPLLAVAPGDDLAQSLWTAPQVIVAHGTQAEPVFFYGNRAALALFEMDFDAFTRLPSRLSAEPVAQSERARLLQAVTERGFIDDYRGVRISASGQRFTIENAVVWNLVDAHGVNHGQAATFAHWQALSAEGA
jgi:hypothetical protein